MRIALIGSAPSSVRGAPYRDASFVEFLDGRPVLEKHHKPFADQTWEIWGCSPGVFGVAERLTAWFEMHRWEPGQTWFSPEYCEWIRKFNGPVYTTEVIPEIPNSVRIPREELIKEFGPHFFTSSLSFMTAMAIMRIWHEREQRKAQGLEPEEDVIAYFGVDMAACTAGDVKVLTADLQWVRADELEVGRKLLAFDEEPQPNGDSIPQRRWRESTVLEASRLMKPCYRVTLEDGREIICSDDHKWLTHAENTARWKMTKDLVTPQHREGRPTKIIKLTDVWVEDKSWEAGYLAAAFDGEGHLSQNLRNGANGTLRAGFAQRDNQMSEAVIEAMQERGFDMTVDSADEGTNGACRKYSVKGGRVENLRFLGSIRPRRLLSKFKPDDLGLMQKAGTVAVVSAEFIGDYPVIGLRTSTKTFIAEGLASHNTEEYSYQRAGCQFFMREALNRGIKIALPPESDLARPMPMYGVSEWSWAHIKILARKRELEGRLNNARAMKANAEREEYFLQGALDDLKYMELTWVLNENSQMIGPDVGGRQLLYMQPNEPSPELFYGGIRAGGMIRPDEPA